MNDSLDSWIGRTREAEFVLDAWRPGALTAALGRPAGFAPGMTLPPFWHHLFGLDAVPADETGPDGHRARGAFLPPVSLPRRMWAGGRLQFEGRLILGETVKRRSVVRAITRKQGRSGPLVFVLVEHRLEGPAGCVIEEHDIVYRGDSGPAGDGRRLDARPLLSRTWQPDEVLLFRYSALTYNAHRIHYDHRYVTAVEGYPGLIVHGPLLATLMLELLREAEESERISRFSFRALRPVFVNRPLQTVVSERSGNNWTLGIVDADDLLAMSGSVTLRS